MCEIFGRDMDEWVEGGGVKEHQFFTVDYSSVLLSRPT